MKPSTRASIAAAAAGLCGLLWWLSLRPPAGELGARHETTAEITEPATVPAAPTPPAPVLNASVAPPRAEQPADGDVEEDPHPHPLTPERDQLQWELQLVGALNDAVDLAHPDRIRAVLEVYRREFTEDPNAMQAGYQVIADCLELPGPTSLAAARRYYREHRASTLRRFVRRHCFEREGR